MTEILTETRLRKVLGQRPFRLYPQIGSTNDVAREWAAQGAPDGAVVVAEEQTAGRGRFARRWDASPGTALLLSVILRLQSTQRTHMGRLPLVGALAVVEALTTLGAQRVAIKWPNDALLNGRKVAGILAETDWQGDTPGIGILGIGLNVRVDFSGSELETRAISAEQALGVPIDRPLLLVTLLARIDFWMARLPDPALLDAWRTRLVTIGQRVTARLPGKGQSETMAGVAIGVDDFGALLVQADEGKLHRLVAGEVTLGTF